MSGFGLIHRAVLDDAGLDGHDLLAYVALATLSYRGVATRSPHDLAQAARLSITDLRAALDRLTQRGYLTPQGSETYVLNRLLPHHAPGRGWSDTLATLATIASRDTVARTAAAARVTEQERTLTITPRDTNGRVWLHRLQRTLSSAAATAGYTVVLRDD